MKPKNNSSPRLMVTGYEIENGFTSPDSSATLKVTIKNTNPNKTVSNIKLMLSDESCKIKPEDEDEKMYAVRTRKILLISNSIATASNVIAVGIAAGVGVAGENPDLVKKAVSYLDVGGLIVTVTRLFSDIRFITKVKEEFINSKIDELLIEELNNLDKYLTE